MCFCGQDALPLCERGLSLFERIGLTWPSVDHSTADYTRLAPNRFKTSGGSKPRSLSDLTAVRPNGQARLIGRGHGAARVVSCPLAAWAVDVRSKSPPRELCGGDNADGS
jgi:hypothetical protein